MNEIILGITIFTNLITTASILFLVSKTTTKEDIEKSIRNNMPNKEDIFNIIMSTNELKEQINIKPNFTGLMK